MKTKPLGKKAQITVFIIIGIVLLFGSAAFFYVQKKMSNDNIKEESQNLLKENVDFNNVETYIDYKIKQRFEEAIYLSAINGGRIYNDEFCYLTQDYKLLYYRYNSIETNPNLTVISDDILRYIAENIAFDLTHDEELLKRGINLNLTDDFKGVVTFSEKEDILEISWPMIATRENSKTVTTLDKFRVKSALRFLKLYNFARYAASHEESISLEYNSLKNESITLNVFPYDSEKIFYTIKDASTSQPLIFMFATNKKSNPYPKFDSIPNFMLKVNETLSYDLHAEDPEGNDVFYESDDPRILIDMDGNFDFYSSKPEEFNVTFYAYNYQYLGDRQTVHFSIVQDDGKDKIIVTSIDKIYLAKNATLNYAFNPISTNLEKITCTSSNSQLYFDSECTLHYTALPKNTVSEIKTVLTFKDESGQEVKKDFKVVRT